MDIDIGVIWKGNKMERPFEAVTDVGLDVMLEMCILKLNMTDERLKHEIIMQDIGFLIVEQLVRMDKTDE